MKRFITGLTIGLIVGSISVSAVFGESIKRNIEVAYNSVNIVVNGNRVQSDNILHDGTTYVPLRLITEMLEKEVVWDSTTRTVSINNKEAEIEKLQPKPETTAVATEKVSTGETITDNGLSVTIEKVKYNEDDFSPNDDESTNIYSKGFGVYYTIKNNTGKTFEKPSFKFKTGSSKYEKEINSIGYSHHPVKSGLYIYPGETLTGFYQYTFEKDVVIKEVEVFINDIDNYSNESFGTWITK